jgi:hypothetical protein
MQTVVTSHSAIDSRELLIPKIRVYYLRAIIRILKSGIKVLGAFALLQLREQPSSCSG